MLDVPNLLDALAQRRPVFHSEADFQFALAWTIQQRHPEVDVRLEYPLFTDDTRALDIFVRLGNRVAAIEVMYPCQRLDVSIDGERFVLGNQARLPQVRYDFVEELTRLELVGDGMPDIVGYAVLLTNNSALWSPSGRLDPVDADYRLEEGRILQGKLAWGPNAAPGTRGKRLDSLDLAGMYRANWHEYVTLPVGEGFRRLRYLAVAVSPRPGSGPAFIAGA